MFSNLTDKFSGVFKKLAGQGKISEANVREAMEEVRTALLEADVHYDVASDFCARVQEKALGTEVLDAVKPGQQMIKIVQDELVELMGGEDYDPSLMFVEPGPTVVMMCGLQGSGKTTTCGKLARRLVKDGKKVLLAAADLQRPAAVDQLETISGQVREETEDPEKVVFYAERERVAEYGEAVGAAVKVARNAVKEGKSQDCDVVILDTAGRLHINDELMGELTDVAEATQPHQILLVVDAMTGQDAVNSARTFNEQLELDGVVLTKFDSDTRGGAALSVKEVTGKPVKFIGTGEKLDALEPFHPDRLAGRILGMGDVVSLVEKAQEQVSEEEAAALQEKMASGQMTMDDFLDQLRKVRKMGSMKSLLGMMPGIGQQLKNVDLDDSQLNRTEAMIQSMTEDERAQPDLLDNSRRRRIARGSGTQSKDISQLVKGFDMMSEMSQQMAGMGMMDKMKTMGGMGDMDLSALAGGGMPQPKKKKRSGRPRFKRRKKKSR
ncbi:MAG: signal recognition particle protein [Phycisphaeraceae bacterium]|nr:signal recognition particle protein [Phycisphaeraceae bacterium]